MVRHNLVADRLPGISIFDGCINQPERENAHQRRRYFRAIVILLV